MTTFRKWYNLNQDRLEKDYEDYLIDFGDIEEAECNEKYPLSFDEFVQDRWDSFDGYVEREEQ